MIRLVSRALPLVLLPLGLLMPGCATTSRPREFAPSAYEAVPGQTQRGQASWYGERAKGKPTASGEIYDPNDFTAAHRTLRFGSLVEVRNLRNNRTVLVEINDRGPFVKGRVIDLSERAAREIGMIGAGVVPVELRLMRPRKR